MNTTRLSFFHRFIYSLYEKNLFKQAASEKLGKAFIYLLILSVFLSVFTLINPILDYMNLVDTFEYSIMNRVPDFILSDSILTADSDELIKIERSGIVIVFDPANQADDTMLDGYLSGFYISRDKFVQKSLIMSQTFVFKQFPGLSFTKEDVVNVFPLLKYLSILLVLFFMAFAFGANIFSVLILSLMLMYIKNRYIPSYKYSDCMKISIYALTLSFILRSIFNTLGLQSGFLFTMLFYGLGIFYGNRALRSLNAPTNDA